MRFLITANYIVARDEQKLRDADVRKHLDIKSVSHFSEIKNGHKPIPQKHIRPLRELLKKKTASLIEERIWGVLVSK